MSKPRPDVPHFPLLNLCFHRGLIPIYLCAVCIYSLEFHLTDVRCLGGQTNAYFSPLILSLLFVYLPLLRLPLLRPS